MSMAYDDMVDIFVEERSVINAMNAWDLALSQTSIVRWLGTGAADILRDRAEMRFANEGDDVSGKWAELKPFTVGARRRAGFPGEHPINERTGALKDWITGDEGDAELVGAQSARLTFPGDTPAGNLQLDTKLRVAQRGQADPATVPRPVLGVNRVDLELLLFGLRDYLLETANKSMAATADLDITDISGMP